MGWTLLQLTPPNSQKSLHVFGTAHPGPTGERASCKSGRKHAAKYWSPTWASLQFDSWLDHEANGMAFKVAWIQIEVPV